MEITAQTGPEEGTQGHPLSPERPQEETRGRKRRLQATGKEECLYKYKEKGKWYPKAPKESDMQHGEQFKMHQALGHPTTMPDRLLELELENRLLQARLLELEKKQSEQKTAPISCETSTWLTPPPSLEIGDLNKLEAVSTVIPRRKARANAGPMSARSRSMAPVCITLAVLDKLSSLSLTAAASRLGISPTAMKKCCRKLGVTRWPYIPRNTRSAHDSREHVTSNFQGRKYPCDNTDASTAQSSQCPISRAQSIDTDLDDSDSEAGHSYTNDAQMLDSDVEDADAATPQSALSIAGTASGSNYAWSPHPVSRDMQLSHPLARLGASFKSSFTGLGQPVCVPSFEAVNPERNSTVPSQSTSLHPLDQLGASFRSSFTGLGVAPWLQSRRESVVVISRQGSFNSAVEPSCATMLMMGSCAGGGQGKQQPAHGHQDCDDDVFGFQLLEQGGGCEGVRDTMSAFEEPNMTLGRSISSHDMPHLHFF